jgi:hypothetical protein
MWIPRDFTFFQPYPLVWRYTVSYNLKLRHHTKLGILCLQNNSVIWVRQNNLYLYICHTNLWTYYGYTYNDFVQIENSATTDFWQYLFIWHGKLNYSSRYVVELRKMGCQHLARPIPYHQDTNTRINLPCPKENWNSQPQRTHWLVSWSGQ